jgi:SAM-dependent methyltransferase
VSDRARRVAARLPPGARGWASSAGRAARRAWQRARGLVARLDPRLRRRDVRRAAPERFVRAAYQIMLRRDADPPGLANWVDHLERGTLDADGVLDHFLGSMELRALPIPDLLLALHQSRCDFVRMLPRARRILDLGGTDQGDPSGALVSMGYPYAFEELVIVDLPHDARHDLYAGSPTVDHVVSPLGPVRYRYHSMIDLSSHPDASYDLVFSGQSIEHVNEADADAMLAGVHRVLEPGGWFCLDTPNRRITALQLGDALTNPDHELEYTHEQLTAKLTAAGFEVAGAYGLAYCGESAAKGVFSAEEMARHRGVYAEPADGYALAYVCRKPGGTA